MISAQIFVGLLHLTAWRSQRPVYRVAALGCVFFLGEGHQFVSSLLGAPPIPTHTHTRGGPESGGCHGGGRSRVAVTRGGGAGSGRAGGRQAGAASTFRRQSRSAGAGRRRGAAGERAPMPGPTQALSPNGENNNDIIQDNGTIIPFRKHTVRGERSYR